MVTDSRKRTGGGMAEDWEDRITSLERRLINLSPLPNRLRPAGQEIDDWDDATEVGFYWSTAGAANEPESRNLVGSVFVHGNGRILQEVSDPSTATADRELTWRRVWDGSSWTTWLLLYQPEDTGWVDLSGHLNAGFSGTFQGRRQGDIVELKAVISGTFNVTTSAEIVSTGTAIPAQFRPSGSVNSWGMLYIAGHPAAIFVRTSGTIGYAQQTGAARSGGQFSLTYFGA